jgi:hypothetical protein
MRPFLTVIWLMMMLASHASSNDENLFKGQSYGSFMFFEEVPNALFFEEGITNNDSFEFRKAIRNHNIDTIVLSSPGGALFEGLTIAGMIFDKELTTYVPKIGRCASACAFMFFAGNNRQATGRLGVHQFYSTSDDKSAKIANVEYGSQFTVSEIIGYLNEFETPPFVFEKMFAQKQMYFFSDDELEKLNTAPTDEATLANFSKIDEFVIKVKEATKQTKAEAVEVETTLEVNGNAGLALRKQIQTELNRIGCALGSVDGKIGPASKRALSRFNKKNKSNYGVKDFFNDKSRLNELKKISSGFCQTEMNPKKIKKSTKDQEMITKWYGYETCPDGRNDSYMSLKRINNSTFEARYHGEKAILSQKRANKYTGKTENYHLILTIDMTNNSLNGTARIRLNSGLGVFVNTFTLGLAQCRIHLSRDE